MAVVQALVSFGLRQVFSGAEDVAKAVLYHFADHSQRLPRALAKANTNAWDALGVALAGDGLLDRVKRLMVSGDKRAIRETVQQFLQERGVSFEGHPERFRKACLEELQGAHKAGVLSTEGLVGKEVARQAASFQRYADAQGLIDGATGAVSLTADALAPAYPKLADLVRQPVQGGPPLLAGLFSYFLRRQVQQDRELADALTFDTLQLLARDQVQGFDAVHDALAALGDRVGALLADVAEQLGRIEDKIDATQAGVLDLQAALEHLAGQQKAGTQELADLMRAVLQLLAGVDLQRGVLQARHSGYIRSEEERQFVRTLLDRFRKLPADQRQNAALLNAFGKVQVGVEDYGPAEATFRAVAGMVSAAGTRAEAFCNAYRAALEAQRWDHALEALQQAVQLDRERFAPFPFETYRPVKILGAGGFGTVFHCMETFVRNRPVAVKALHTGDLQRPIDTVFAEAHALNDLARRHGTLLEVYHCSFFDVVQRRRPYIVMQHFDGVSLAAFLARGEKLSEKEAALLAYHIASGMQVAHQHGIYHRDLKPDNLLIRRDGDKLHVKIIDFGLVLRRSTVETSKPTGSGRPTQLGASIAGTQEFAPPEQLGKLRDVPVGPYSDVFSFGLTCLFGLFRKTRLTRSDWGRLPEPLAKLFEHCIIEDVKDRCQSFDEVLKHLDAMRKGKKTPVQEPPQREQQGQPAVAKPNDVPARPVSPPEIYPEAIPVVQPAARAVPKSFTNSLGMKFVLVPRGTFWMGGEGGKPGDRQVEIPHDFYLGVFTVTQGEWQAVMGSKDEVKGISAKDLEHFPVEEVWDDEVGPVEEVSWHDEISAKDLEHFPVEEVSWDDAQQFIARLNEKEGSSGWMYRLPTEAEWEYACRGGANSKQDCSFDFYFDKPTNDLYADRANFDGTYPAGKGSERQYLERPTKVGSYPPNRLGLHDMHGNVWEWCEDLYEGGPGRVIRGGSWRTRGPDCRAASRSGYGPADRDVRLGLRLARVPSGG